MTTGAAAGSGASGGNPQPGSSSGTGNPNGANGAAGDGSSNGANGFLAVLSEDNRKIAEAKGWSTPDKLNGLFDSYRGLETKLGSEPRLPSATAEQAELDKAYRHLGWPEKPEAYNFAMPQGLPENFPYDEGFAEDFKKWAHEARLSPKAAQALHDKYVGRFANDVTARQGEIAKNVNSVKEWMIKQFGGETSDTYRQSSEAARRAVVLLEGKPEYKGLRQELAASGLIIPGEGDHFTPANAAIMELLISYGNTHSMDHQFVGGSGQGSGPAGNPFADATLNVTQQAQIKRRDPVKARELIVAAGKNPQEWGL